MSEQVLSESTRQEIDHWIKKYPQERKQSAVIPALHIVQEQNGGWLSDEMLTAVADYLEMPKIAVYEVATFYSMYDLKPVAKHKINVCTNISCMLRGSEKVMQHLEDKLGCKAGEISSDGQFLVREVECLGACVGAPMMQIDKKYYENLTPDKIDEILAQFKVENQGSE